MSVVRTFYNAEANHGLNAVIADPIVQLAKKHSQAATESVSYYETLGKVSDLVAKENDGLDIFTISLMNLINIQKASSNKLNWFQKHIISGFLSIIPNKVKYWISSSISPEMAKYDFYAETYSAMETRYRTLKG